MRDGGRVAAALDVLADFEARRVPLKVCLSDWARRARFAGAKDRAFISGLSLDVLRRRRSLGARGALRVVVAACLHHQWAWSPSRIKEAFAEEPHGPGILLAEEEEAAFAPSSQDLPEDVLADIPPFTHDLLSTVMDDLVAEGTAMAMRAPIDLRVNLLKATPEKAIAALAGMGAEPSPLAYAGLRIPAPHAEDRGPQVTNTPAYQKGWVEIQDEASQLAALAVGPIDGGQILDLCAGGGGKTLALAAHLGNRGQVFAYDQDAGRLAPIFDRLRRAGTRNVQVLSPAEQGTEKLAALEGEMDVVFVDAPCSGMGTWRRHPDTKWRLTEAQLANRQAEQDAVLDAAARFVKPGGLLIYVTCSLLREENEDRIAAFRATQTHFQSVDPKDMITRSGGLKQGALLPDANVEGFLRFSPYRTGTDGFTICVLRAES